MTAIAEFGTPYAARDRLSRNRALVRGWLYVVLLVLFALFLVGGATRLTDSGLSITEWKPIHGVIPPLNDAEWQEEFAKYQQIPEYQQINQGMSSASSRRSSGGSGRIASWRAASASLFALPLLFFWVTGRLERGLLPKLVGLLLLGGLQGAVGWWMVASGLVERIDVSQYRLATHLTARLPDLRGHHGRGARARAAQRSAGRPARRSASPGLLLILVLLQIYLGGLVAGLDAGLSYNTWPLMDGASCPAICSSSSRPGAISSRTRRPCSSCIAAAPICCSSLALWHMIATRRRLPGTTHARRALVLFVLVLVQAAIGIGTLVHAGAAASGADASGLRADRARLCRRALARHQGQLSACRPRSRSAR